MSLGGLHQPLNDSDGYKAVGGPVALLWLVKLHYPQLRTQPVGNLLMIHFRSTACTEHRAVVTVAATSFAATAQSAEQHCSILSRGGSDQQAAADACKASKLVIAPPWQLASRLPHKSC
jgi:hypothetical protein